MKQLARTTVIGVCTILIGSFAAIAGSYTVHLSDGRTVPTRYPPQFGQTHVRFLTKAGHWMNLPQEHVALVTNDTEAGRQTRMLDSKTILIGRAPNDAPAPPSPSGGRAEPLASPQAVEPVAVVLGYLALRGPRPVLDYSYSQFVDTEDLSGGIPIAGIFTFNVLEPEPLEEIFGVPAHELTTTTEQEIRQGLPPGGFEKIQGLPPGGLQLVQGISLNPAGSQPAGVPLASGGSPPD
jgi:hypothetical protein